MIESESGYIAFLAHLKNESILLGEGEEVRKGDVIGLVGNSGNSTMPHLHINLFDQMDDPYKAQVLPFVFSHYESMGENGNWLERTLSLPTVGTVVRFHA